MTQQLKKWTVVFLVYADFRTSDTLSMNESMEIELNTMLEDILRCPINADAANVYVVLDGIQYSFVHATGQLEIREATLVYEIGAGTNKENEIQMCKVIERARGPITGETPGHHIFHRPQRLTPLLQEYIPPFPDNEVLLITWDHGSAFGMFRDDPPDHLPPMIRKPIDDHLDCYPYLKKFWERAYQESNFNEFMGRKRGQDKPRLVLQIGQSLYTLHSVDDHSAFFVNFILDQKTCDLFRVKVDVSQNGAHQLEFNSEYYSSLASENIADFLTADQKKMLDAQLSNEATLAIGLGNPAVPEILENRELSAVLTGWLQVEFPEKKAGVVLMMNCWMMNLHTMYALKGKVQYLVAPQGNIDCPGYDYARILASVYFHGATAIEPEQLASECVRYSHNDELRERAKKLNEKFGEKTIEYRSIMNVRLDYPASNDSFNELLAQFIDMINMLHKLVSADPDCARFYLCRYVRALSFDFTEMKASMVDLPNYLYSLTSAVYGLRGNMITVDFATAAYGLLNNVQSALPMVMPKFIGKSPYVWKEKEITVITALCPTGYSIYFPNDTNSIDKLTDNVNNDQLLNGPFKEWMCIIKKIMLPGPGQ